MSDCTCTAGTEDNGWHEERCEPCLKAELAEWGWVTAWIRGNPLTRRTE